MIRNLFRLSPWSSTTIIARSSFAPSSSYSAMAQNTVTLALGRKNPSAFVTIGELQMITDKQDDLLNRTFQQQYDFHLAKYKVIDDRFSTVDDSFRAIE